MPLLAAHFVAQGFFQADALGQAALVERERVIELGASFVCRVLKTM